MVLHLVHMVSSCFILFDLRVQVSRVLQRASNRPRVPELPALLEPPAAPKLVDLVTGPRRLQNHQDWLDHIILTVMRVIYTVLRSMHSKALCEPLMVSTRTK